MNMIKALLWTILILAAIIAAMVLSAIIVPIAIVGVIFYVMMIIQQDLSDNDN